MKFIFYFFVVFVLTIFFLFFLLLIYSNKNIYLPGKKGIEIINYETPDLSEHYYFVSAVKTCLSDKNKLELEINAFNENIQKKTLEMAVLDKKIVEFKKKYESIKAHTIDHPLTDIDIPSFFTMLYVLYVMNEYYLYYGTKK